MTRPTYTPDRDIDWLDRNTDAARANALAMFATLEHIACNCTDADTRTIAHAALNKVLAWRPLVVVPVSQEF